MKGNKNKQTNKQTNNSRIPVFSYKSRYIVGFWLVEMAISTNQKPTIYRNLYENTGQQHKGEKWIEPIIMSMSISI